MREAIGIKIVAALRPTRPRRSSVCCASTQARLARASRQREERLVPMPASAADGPYIHFETCRTKPRVFRITQALIDEAKARNNPPADLARRRLARSFAAFGRGRHRHRHRSDRRPETPRRHLQDVAPNLRWIQVTGAGIEPSLPLDWLPRQVVLLKNSGVHVEKIRELAAMTLLMPNAWCPISSPISARPGGSRFSRRRSATGPF